MQDSKEDWQKESLRIEIVCSHSCCNVAATESSDSPKGCFVDQPAPTCHPGIPDIANLRSEWMKCGGWIGRNIHKIVEPNLSQEKQLGVFSEYSEYLWRRELLSSVLLQRAWGF
jgi:hypothetical protein